MRIKQVTGDTVGDPFKTSGPSMNILIKLTCLIGLVIAPILEMVHIISEKAACCTTTEMCTSMSKEECMEKDVKVKHVSSWVQVLRNCNKF
jgi:K(+)-stimulated pyrophosphate-energized sodium pump